MSSLDDHYAHLAQAYNENWSHSQAFLQWMTSEIAARLVRSSEPAALAASAPFQVCDVGAGTGLFAKLLLDLLPQPAHVYCIDPSQAMLDEIGSNDHLTAVRASADDTPQALQSIGVTSANAILLKEVVHHFESPAATLAGLCALLQPNGRLLVVMLPPTIDYPLFAEAIRRYEEAQPHYDAIAEALRARGLTVTVEKAAFPLEFDSERYVHMVESRYMSVLSTFSDVELTAGINEMRAKIGSAPTLSFSDSFMFIIGVKTD